MNPAPDADLHSVGQANFEWIVREVADLAIAKAKSAPQLLDLKWSAFLDGKAEERPDKSTKKSSAPEKPKTKNAAKTKGTKK
jgi:hypothetical protein